VAVSAVAVAASEAAAVPAAGDAVKRMLRHLLIPRWRLYRYFPQGSLQAIEAAIRAAERTHGGEIRFAIETSLDFRRLWSGETSRQRAHAVFSRLRVWDTERNNGVLIYVLLADRQIEIIADRGFAGRVGDEEWQAACRCMETEFCARQFEAGALAGVRRVSTLIARHFPWLAADDNELPDAPALVDGD
jgi:uncharacterized membrane protein